MSPGGAAEQCESEQHQRGRREPDPRPARDVLRGRAGVVDEGHVLERAHVPERGIEGLEQLPASGPGAGGERERRDEERPARPCGEPGRITGRCSRTAIGSPAATATANPTSQLASAGRTPARGDEKTSGTI